MDFKNLFGKNKKKFVTLKSNIDINTKINEIFSSTKVTQKIFNSTEDPIELEISIKKYLNNIIFSSFYAQVGKNTIVKSKVIKEEKAEEKYTDSISSGNVGIYTALDKYNKNNIIVHIGNIPPKEELTFISEFIQFTESSKDFYEYELFRNVPTLIPQDKKTFENDMISGSLEINLKDKIITKNEFLSNNLIIKEEKFDKINNKYSLKYQYNSNSFDYIKSNKIYFKTLNDVSEPVNLFSQISTKNKNEQNFILNYKLEQKTENIKKPSKEDLKLSPALFIFLLDQSGSMAGSPIKVASKALLLFLQSLPAGSYYQIIGFGSKYKLYDDKPKEYNQENIQKSIKIVESLKGNMGGTNIYDPLNYIYNSNSNYNNILLPRNIFLLTDGEIDNKGNTLKLIEQNSNEYSVYSFGMGNSFDEDLIKNAGIVGKGSYSFCRDIKGLSQVIASTLNNICTSYTTNLNINSELDKFNLYKLNNIQNIVLQNKTYRCYYIIEKEKFENKKLNFEMEYTQNNENHQKKYSIETKELIPGDELSKLIIYEYLNKEKELSSEEKIKLALKYQIFIDGTSLFAEVESNVKATEKIQKKEIIKEENQSQKTMKKISSDPLEKKIDEYEERINNLEVKRKELINEAKEKLKAGNRQEAERILKKQIKLTDQIKRLEGDMAIIEEQKMMMDNALNTKSVSSIIKAAACCVKNPNCEDIESLKEEMEEQKASQEELNNFFKEYNDEDEVKEQISCLVEELNEENNNESNPKKSEEIKEEEDLNKFLGVDDDMPKPKKEIEEKKEEEEDLKLDLNKKDDVMKIINSQNFIEGFWDINGKTKIIQKKYEKEFKLLKEKNIDDITAMTIIIIYFINKEHQELIEELVMILKKAKLYIQDKAKDSYENIIKNDGIK